MIWYLEGNSKLPKNFLNAIENQENEMFYSIVSFWEIAIKTSLGKLEIDGTIRKFETRLRQLNIEKLSIEVRDLEELEQLEFLHRDPFDRLLVSQSFSRDMELFSVDDEVAAYF